MELEFCDWVHLRLQLLIKFGIGTVVLDVIVENWMEENFWAEYSDLEGTGVLWSLWDLHIKTHCYLDM